MTASPLRLSVLDLVPVRSDQSSADAVAASLSLARLADRLGFHRYWFAEHHNMPSVASTSPAVLIGIAAAGTERIRVGSGGVMLPNHAPLVVAEQFGLLESAFPGRIDLGLGRAPGSDPMVTALLRAGGTGSDVEDFPAHVRDIASLLNRDGALLRLTSGRHYAVRATPAVGSGPEIWLLGSSDYSARLAADLGLSYVFAHHFEGVGTAEALEQYRRGFVATDALPAPRTFLTVNVSVAETAEEAALLALPQLQQMALLRTGQPLTRLASVEEAQGREMTELQHELIERMRRHWVIGAPVSAADRLRRLAEQFQVDEVMLVPTGSAPAGADPSTAPARAKTLELLAGELLP